MGRIVLLLFALAAAGTLFPACKVHRLGRRGPYIVRPAVPLVRTPEPVVVPTAPPVPRPAVAVRPVRPGPRHAWVEGHHRWSGSAYVWVPGRWVLPPRAGAVWVTPKVVRKGRHWHLTVGYWR